MALLAVLPLDLLHRVLESDALTHKDIARFAMASPRTRDVVRACPTLFASIAINSDVAHRYLLSALGAGEVRSLTFKGSEHRHTIDTLLDVAHMHPERVRHLTRIKFDNPGTWVGPFFAALAMFPSLREIALVGPIFFSQQMEFMMDERVTVEHVIFTSSMLAKLRPKPRMFVRCNLQIDSAADLCAAVQQGTRTRALFITGIDRDVIISNDTAACVADMVEEELILTLALPEHDYGNIINACVRRNTCSIYNIMAHSNANVAALAAALATGRQLATLHVTLTHSLIDDLTPLSPILRDRVSRFAMTMFMAPTDQAVHLAHAFDMAAPMRVEELELAMPMSACVIVLPRIVAPALKKLTLLTTEHVGCLTPPEALGQSIAALPALEELEIEFGRTPWLRAVVDALLRSLPAGHPLRRVKTPRLCLMDNSDTLDVAAFRARPVTIAYPTPA